jgi:DNA-binding transcriptional LysR family regulator
MRLKSVDLNLYVVFDAIYRERNLTRAADRLCLTQPAVSNALSRLREAYGDPLFQRSGRAMEPTALSQSMVLSVRQALRLLEETIDKTREFNPAQLTARYSIIMHDWMEALALPNLLAAIRAVAPGVHISTYSAQKHEAIKGLASGSAVLCVGAATLMDSTLNWETLFSDRYICLMRHGHPLETGELTLEHYLAAEHIHVSSRITGGGQVDAALRPLGAKRNIACRTQHYLVAPRLAEKSDMLLTMPARLATLCDLPTRELPFEVPELGVYLYWHNSTSSNPDVVWLREMVKNAT